MGSYILFFQSRIRRNVSCARRGLLDVVGQEVLLTAHLPTAESGRLLQVPGRRSREAGWNVREER